MSFARLLVLCSPLLLAACATAPQTPVAPQSSVVRIGIAGPTSGVLAHLGRDNENGARLAIEELNQNGFSIGGQRVSFELVGRDDRADPRQGVAVAQQLVAARVQGVVGHLNSGTSVPAFKVYADAGIPSVTPSATNPKLTRQGLRTAFRVVVDDLTVGRVMGRHAADLRFASVVIVDDRSAYGQGMADAFESGLREAGGEAAGREFTSTFASDFSAQARRIVDSGADAVFYGGMDREAMLLLEELAQLGWKGKFLGGDGICTGEIGAVRLAAQILCAEPGGLIEGPGSQEMQAFKQRFRNRFGVNVQVFAPQAYDAVMLLADAMQRAGSSDPARYLPVLAATRHYPGVTGRIGFDAKGDLLEPLVPVYGYRGGRRVFVQVLR